MPKCPTCSGNLSKEYTVSCKQGCTFNVCVHCYNAPGTKIGLNCPSCKKTAGWKKGGGGGGGDAGGGGGGEDAGLAWLLSRRDAALQEAAEQEQQHKAPPRPAFHQPPPQQQQDQGGYSQYPPPQQGYPPQGYPPQQGGYPQYPPQQGYPPQGYPPQQGYPQGYYPPPQGYPPQQGYPQYPPPQQGYPPQGYYPPPQQGYPPQQGGVPPQQQQRQGGYDVKWPRERIESLMERQGTPFNHSGGWQLRQVWAGDDSANPDYFIFLYDSGVFKQLDHDSWGDLGSFKPSEGTANNVTASAYRNGVMAVVTNLSQIEWKKIGEPKSRKTRISAPGLTGEGRALALLQNPAQAAVYTETLGLIDLETGRAIRNLKIQNMGSPMGFAEVPSQPGCVLLMDTNGKIGMFDLNASEAEPVKLIPGMGAYPRDGIKFNPTNPNQFLCCSGGEPLKIFDVRAGRAVTVFEDTDAAGSYAIYGNTVLYVKTSINLRLAEFPKEDVYSFASRNYDSLDIAVLTPSGVVAVGSSPATVYEYKFSK